MTQVLIKRKNALKIIDPLETSMGLSSKSYIHFFNNNILKNLKKIFLLLHAMGVSKRKWKGVFFIKSLYYN